MFTKKELSLLSPNFQMTFMHEQYIIMEQDMTEKANQLQSYIFHPNTWSEHNEKKIYLQLNKSSSDQHYFLANCYLSGGSRKFYKNSASIRRAEIQILTHLSKEPEPDFDWKNRMQEIQSFHFTTHVWNSPVEIEPIFVSQYIDLAYHLTPSILLVGSGLHNINLYLLSDGSFSVAETTEKNGDKFSSLEKAYDAFKVSIAGSRLRKLFK